MARAPFQVLVYPYRRNESGKFEYALLRRADQGWWQGVAGGGEDIETPLEAARRESWEEAGITPDSTFLPLDTVFSVRATEFGESHHWGEQVYVVPSYCFGVLADASEITLSHEHTDYRWLDYAAADRLMKYDGNRTALWELDMRLRGRGPRR